MKKYPFYKNNKLYLLNIYKNKQESFLSFYNDFSNAVDDYTTTGLHYSFNVIDKNIYFNNHVHDYDSLLKQVYLFPETFTVPKVFEYEYSKQQLLQIAALKKLLVTDGLNDIFKNGKIIKDEFNKRGMKAFKYKFNTNEDMKESILYTMLYYNNEKITLVEYFTNKILSYNNNYEVLKEIIYKDIKKDVVKHTRKTKYDLNFLYKNKEFYNEIFDLIYYDLYRKQKNNFISINKRKKYNFKNINKYQITNIYQSENEVLELTSNKKKYILKIEKNKITDLNNEEKYINNLFYYGTPKIIEKGIIEGNKYILMEKIDGDKLPEIIKDMPEKKTELLFNYGMSLGNLHNFYEDNKEIALDRPINNLVKDYKTDGFIENIISFLKDKQPEFNNDTFIHGEYHYDNIIWKYNFIKGIIDFKYSGYGFKEQDIALAVVLRPNQNLMSTKKDLDTFLNGYKKSNKFDKKSFSWCYVNVCTHYYLMNIDNTEYIKQLKKLINIYIKEI